MFVNQFKEILMAWLGQNGNIKLRIKRTMKFKCVNKYFDLPSSKNKYFTPYWFSTIKDTAVQNLSKLTSHFNLPRTMLTKWLHWEHQFLVKHLHSGWWYSEFEFPIITNKCDSKSVSFAVPVRPPLSVCTGLFFIFFISLRKLLVKNN